MTSVLVVRKPDAFSRILESSGFEVVNCPAIETVPIRSSIKIAHEIDGVFITSRAAAEVFRSVERFDGAVHVLGRSSFEILKDRGFDLRFHPAANTALEMLESVPREELAGKRFVFVRGEESLGIVTEYLAAIALVEELIVYRTDRVAIDRAVTSRTFDWICFFSPSAARSLIEQAGADFVGRAKAAAIGPTTAEELRMLGITAALVASRSSAEVFAEELIEKGN